MNKVTQRKLVRKDKVVAGLVVFYVLFLTIMNIKVNEKLEIFATNGCDSTSHKEDAQKPWSTQDHYDIPLRNLWNLTAMNDSIVASKQMADAPPEESQWLKTPINQSSFGANSTNGTIPKHIHKVYIEKSGKFPSVQEREGMISLETAHKSWISANPGYDVDLYNLAGCRKYLAKNFHPIFLRTFDCISAFAGKVDFFRMAVVYLEGGWYSDWKQVCLQHGLLESLGSNISLYVVWDRGNQMVINEKCVQTCFFGASPFHPLIAIMLKMIMNNVRNEIYGKSGIHPTGPCLLGQAYKVYLKQQNPNKNGVREGIFQDLKIYSSDNRPLIQHKCADCGTDQNWMKGNNYNDLHSKRTYYCPDAQSLYESADLLRK